MGILAELADLSNWNLLLKKQYNAQVISNEPLLFIPLSNDDLIVDANILQVACSSINRKNTWYVGCWISVLLENNPSEFSSDSEIAKATIPLRGNSKLIQFPRYLPPRYKLLISFPKWIRDLSLEVWAFDGDQTSPEMEKFLEIENILNSN